MTPYCTLNKVHKVLCDLVSACLSKLSLQPSPLNHDSGLYWISLFSLKQQEFFVLQKLFHMLFSVPGKPCQPLTAYSRSSFRPLFTHHFFPEICPDAPSLREEPLLGVPHSSIPFTAFFTQNLHRRLPFNLSMSATGLWVP